MSGAETKPNPTMADPFSSGLGAFGGAVTETGSGSVDGYLLPSQGSSGGALDRAQANVVTAQRVAIKRNVGAILRDARALAQAAGDKFFYRIPFKNKRTGQTTFVEGPTIGCAMAAASLYGNCSIRALPVQDTPTAWTFMAEFCDYEKGVTVVRSFQQRKEQNTGMGDGGRQLDIVFQIGQSKAMRNVVVGALGWLTEEMEDAAKSGVLDRIGREPEKARAWLVSAAAKMEIALVRMERIMGRSAKDWTVPDMAKLFAQISSIRDGFATADDLFPLEAAAAEEVAEDTGPAPKPAAPVEEKPKRQYTKRATPVEEPRPTAPEPPPPTDEVNVSRPAKMPDPDTDTRDPPNPSFDAPPAGTDDPGPGDDLEFR